MAEQPKIHKCVVCGADNSLSFSSMDAENKSGQWFLCRCGCLNRGAYTKVSWNEMYKNRYKDMKGLESRLAYLRSVYLPIIEEATYGRKYLDVGFTVPLHIEALRERGWIVDGIDLLDNKFIKGDFENHEFKIRKYDMIFMGDILETFENPKRALAKAHHILNDTGILFITTACVDLMYEVGVKRWGCWNNTYDNVYFSKARLRTMLEQMGFEIILQRENWSQRFTSWNNQHVICQVKQKEIKDMPKVIGG